MSTTTEPLLAERLEAQARQLMAAHARLAPARGWDSIRERLDSVAAIDAVLDAWLATR